MLRGCRELLSPEEEATARDAYLTGLSALTHDANKAQQELLRAANVCPWIAEPLVWLAYLQLQRGDREGARPRAARAEELLAQWGTPWDKRLSYGAWSWLAAFLTRQLSDPTKLGPLPAPNLRDLLAFLEQLQERRWIRIDPSPPLAEEPEPVVAGKAGVGTDAAVSRFHSYVASFASRGNTSRMSVYPGLRTRPWHEPAKFPLARALRDAYPEIQREIGALDEGLFSRERENIARTGDWSILFFNERGRRHEEVAARCPVTSGIIEAHRAVRTFAGLSYVSRLRPGTHVTSHYGATNLRLRCHLALKVPTGNCAIRVDGQLRQWKEGECLVFDDFLLHEAWNHASGDRVVLIVDLWHPDLADEEIRLLEGLHRYAAAQGAFLEAFWAANARARSVREAPVEGPARVSSEHEKTRTSG